jgi:hypothetical protein
MPQAVRDSLMAKQDEHNINRHRVNPVALTDGRWALNADVLTEAHQNGLFAHVDLIDPDALAQVVAEPWADVLALLPVAGDDGLAALAAMGLAAVDVETDAP